MKLLIITQKVDRDDPVLGFFHGWLAKFAEKFESVSVICLQKGVYDLPSNVQVYSLGKEHGGNKLKYIFKFFHLCFFSLNYSSVFVHMNQEYILLGGLFWKILSKKIYLWRNHKKGNLLTRIAVLLSEKVFCTSRDSYTAKFKKTVLMPVGIDTDLFKDGKMERRKNSILSLGRISLVKNLHIIIAAARILRERGVNFVLDIVGDPANLGDVDYKKKLVEENKDLTGDGLVNFYPSVPNYETPEIYSKYEMFLNLTPSGSFDKTILEAAACGSLPIIVNTSLSGAEAFKDLIIELEPNKIAEKIEFWLKADENMKREVSQKLRDYVFQNHSLNALIGKLETCIKAKK